MLWTLVLIGVGLACECEEERLGNGVCEEDCYLMECGWDEGDCGEFECATGCLYAHLSNGVCDLPCLTASCHYDSQDCPPRLLASSTTEELYKPKNYGLVAGVGLGTFLIIFSGALGLVFCICSFATQYQIVCILIGLAIPLIVICIILFSPTEQEENQKTDTRVDKYVIARTLFLVLIIPFTLIAAIVNINSVFGIEVKTRRVDSRAVGEAKAEKLDLEVGGNDQSMEQAGPEQGLLPLPIPPVANPQ